MGTQRLALAGSAAMIDVVAAIAIAPPAAIIFRLAALTLLRLGGSWTISRAIDICWSLRLVLMTEKPYQRCRRAAEIASGNHPGHERSRYPTSAMFQVGNVTFVLFGRDDVCATLDNLLASLRSGRGGALVIAGPAGIGKTSLLEYAADGATGLRLLRFKGVPDEACLPYAGLSQGLTPVLDRIPLLPEPQGAAVSAALAVRPSTGTDIFAVCAGTLGLLAVAAAEGRLVVLVDDAHWLDPESMQALCLRSGG